MDPANRSTWPDLGYELPLWQAGYSAVAGLDEAGRGALAGPVAAGAVILPPRSEIHSALSGVRDSKLMTPSARLFWAKRIRDQALAWGIGWATSAEIDQWGILHATRVAMTRALENLVYFPEFLLVDFLILGECPLPQIAIVKGDVCSLSIAAASVLAKTARDAEMRRADGEYPGYGFAQHKGYGTLSHRQALSRLGSSPIHRRSFHCKEL